MKIQFIGAAREVTGSKHLITTQHGKNILLDCGMFQGKGLETDSMNRDLGFDPKEIDHIILSHAHIDHSGLIPFLFRNGFNGSVICTTATRNLCAYMLPDSGYIQEHDIKWFNKKRSRQGLPPVQPIYTKDDALQCMRLFIAVDYNRKFRVDENISVKFTNSGHMLGSAVANLTIKENGVEKTIAYTGDIGRPYNRIIKPPSPFPQAQVVITESTYGNRLHSEITHSEQDLLDIVNYTCVQKGGKLIIPSFSVGRTQEVVYSFNNFYNEGKIPAIDVYVDSPLSVNITEVFRMHPECFNEDVHEVMETDNNPFGFKNLRYIKNVNDSKKLNDIDRPCVIISASGMMEAGRVKHHLANSISNRSNSVLAVGYCAPNTLGAKILRGDKTVSIFGTEYTVRADIFSLDSYSGHGDYKEMAQFLTCQNPDELQQLVLVHGDYEAQLQYTDYLKSTGFRNILIPEKGQSITL